MTTIFGTTVPIIDGIRMRSATGRFGPFGWAIHERAILDDGTPLYVATVDGLGLQDRAWASGAHPYGLTIPEAARWVEDRIRGYQADLRAFLATDLT